MDAPSNIRSMLMTLPTFQLERGWLYAVAPLNILIIEIALETFQLLMF